MGFWTRLIRGERTMALAAADPAATFAAIDSTSVPPQFFGLSSYPTAVALSAPIDRQSAIQVPAVKAARDLIADIPASLPLNTYGPDNVPSPSALVAQPERHVPRSVTLARTFDDLLFHGTAWWLVVEVGWHGFPTKVERLDPRSVSLTTEGRAVLTRQGASGQVVRWLEDSEIIRFDSPNDPLLVAGARAIRCCLSLDAAASRYSDGSPPVDYFTPTDGIETMGEQDVTDLLDSWKAARQTRATGYVPAGLQYNVAGWNPEQLQLSDARQHATLEIARLSGVDPEALAVSTTSRTYFNSQDRRKAFIDFTLQPFMRAFEERLSMPDVTPRGYTVRFDRNEFLRSDDLTRQQVYNLGLQNGSWTREEIRAAEGKPPVAVAAVPAVNEIAGEDAADA